MIDPYMAFPPPLPDFSPEGLMRRLTGAVAEGDIRHARRIFDMSFLHNDTVITPDALHLYLAIRDGRRDIVRLLVTYGASFTPSESAALLPVLGQKAEDMKYVLREGRRHAKPAVENETEIPCHVLFRLLSELKQVGLEDKKLESAAARALGDALLHAVENDDAEMIHETLQLRDAGVMTVHRDYDQKLRRIVRPALSLEKEFIYLLSPDGGGDVSRALGFIGYFHDHGFAVAPMDVAQISAAVPAADYIAVMAFLAERQLLREDQMPELRAHILKTWAQTQDTMSMTEMQYVETARARRQANSDFQPLARVLFNDTARLTKKEVREFVDRHKRHSRMWPSVLARHDGHIAIEEHLARLGLFDNPAFTVSLLSEMEKVSAGELARAFNHAAIRKVAHEKGLAPFLSEKNIRDLPVVLPRLKTPPTAKETVRILDLLHRLAEKRVQENRDPYQNAINRMLAQAGIDMADRLARDVIGALVQAGADFTTIDPMKYMGRHSAAVAQALLSCGVARAENFNFSQFADKIDVGAVFAHKPVSETVREYTLFVTQACLEMHDPETFIPRRQEADFDYVAALDEIMRAHGDKLNIVYSHEEYSKNPYRGNLAVKGLSPPSPRRGMLPP